MAQNNFIFLKKEYPILYNIGTAAEYNLHIDPITSLFKFRQLGEKISEILFGEHHLDLPTENTFHNRIKTLEFEKLIPRNILDFFFLLKDKGTIAVHQNKGSKDDAKHCLFSAFKLSKWFYETYSQENKNIDQIKFNVPEQKNVEASLAELEAQYKILEDQFNKLLEDRVKDILSKEEQTKIQARSAKAANKLEMSEAETREIIDDQLIKAGWLADTKTINFKKHGTLPQRGKFMAIAEWPAGSGWADYALFIGYELYAIVDAWVTTSGYIPIKAVQTGLYMDTLSNRQSVALCVLDLAKGYEYQTKNYYDGFILKCCELVLQYHSVNAQAILLKAETLKRIYEKQLFDKDQNAKETYNQMEQLYARLFDLGYREMPEKMYLKWLISVTQQRDKYFNKEIKTIK